MYEDNALCLNLHKMGLSSRVASAWVKHEGHATFKKSGKDDIKIQSNALPIYKSLYPKIMTIALTKNEANAIEGFLKQFGRWPRAILDSGSDDNTIQIATQYAKHASRDFDGFASQRNAAIDLLGQEADWIFMLDPDERINPGLPQILEQLIATSEYDIYLMPLEAKYADGSVRQFVAKPFLFRRSSDIRWCFKVHEKLIGSHKQAIITNFKIVHELSLHSPSHRQSSESLYSSLADQEPYFTDPSYKADMHDKWPILDYDHLDDPRIAKVYVGPLVSVVMPTYNRPELLVRAIESVLQQDYRPIECIVVGDNCPCIAAVAEKYKFNPIVRFLNLPNNNGAGGAMPRNVGIHMANGRWIAYLDDDNKWETDHLSHLMDLMLKADARFGFSSMSVNGKPLIFDVPKQGDIDTSCVIHHKDLAYEKGMWKSREEDGYTHDWAFFERLLVDEKYVASKKPTLVYNAETSGQRDWILSRVS